MRGIPSAVLDAWGLSGAQVSEIASGLINQTYLVSLDSRQWVLQCLHPVFDESIHQNIAAVTQHLFQKGMQTPLLVPTQDKALFAREQDQIWRLLTHVSGHNFEQVNGAEHAEAAGRLVAEFHHALLDLQHDFVGLRSGVHDTAKHLEVLDLALANHEGHRLFKDVQAMALQMQPHREQLLDFNQLATRTSHGDLKISNLMFDGSGQGLCLIDLDTLGPMPWPVELADAFRSWCAPFTEDDPNIHFDLELFAAALKGYFGMAKDFWTESEKQSLVAAIATICFELSTRFLADALNETYFGFDSQRYPARGEHNFARAQSQWRLCKSVRAQQEQMMQMVGQVAF